MAGVSCGWEPWRELHPVNGVALRLELYVIIENTERGEQK